MHWLLNVVLQLFEPFLVLAQLCVLTQHVYVPVPQEPNPQPCSRRCIRAKGNP
ncbi:hypothetical protein AGABI1DRAFT_84876 [Agaricus bisporus var. burnettii JB137-S8]|uniref:Uncharacterized protein n=1 Tax=Agaricus bisporus var. burnettii (strain JB137-S8 / ATCC MYA-4627 / FGSC 10392) TaxID=597362 RepID=K5WY26_AGABU|nr:hypothetical protein AGABI2DRAFT_135229 [Agaricus bisporus var. bisporus H97]XP_007329569.1 uncharacterized protein AGABI1DRAFT_84876 [Agaricus bisporus var. burnettii JB137-S8]EKM80416.1 hypothetical protein AGABI1DRAFT_84876 [Agaricus bisporus var. burnettii JB137-S8]EKV48104.1 hypothetical protein AGABI2DRAFT_135229 [Agaricus bisporus var. bisporus H97]